MSDLETIVEELKTLPAPKLAQVSKFVHQLKQGSREESLNVLRTTSGIISPTDADKIEMTIQEGCEQIDANSW